jgi:hypothetical protein
MTNTTLYGLPDSVDTHASADQPVANRGTRHPRDPQVVLRERFERPIQRVGRVHVNFEDRRVYRQEGEQFLIRTVERDQSRSVFAPRIDRNDNDVSSETRTSQPQVLSLEELVLEHVRAMVVQVGILLSRELAHAHAGVDAPRIQKLLSNLWNDD